tara:strand:- start:604 stop:1008 length:405 start_codon:yes stop_codon:yes gene_type:complete
MQTFLPYSDFTDSVKCLDYKRLGKQRVEAMQTYNQITKGKGGYPYHPVNKMWQDYPNALAYYHNLCIDEWIARGYKNTMSYIPFDQFGYEMDMPHWLGNEQLHASHRSNLLRKDYAFYSQYGWQEPTDMPYIWL